MNKTEYSVLDLEQVLYIHEIIIESTGGKQGIRDYTILHSALERCKATFAGRDLYPTILEKASALMHSLVKNHAFLDGKKRTAYAITSRFLNANKKQIVASQQEIIDFCVAIDNDDWEVVQILEWLKSHTKEVV